ncbi:hypothetical protein GCM10007362_48670 [Saccharibacillus endophyticus]|uniref:Uncharacterized protein n=1 Tax=Saccharibacillus endophyticus TaxID=2060666 RepID=A0ABQ2A6S9_9BACL|nr:hypothetical protein GCM10007362_48670 [Saccharibacillus endophyticus]
MIEIKPKTYSIFIYVLQLLKRIDFSSPNKRSENCNGSPKKFFLTKLITEKINMRLNKRKNSNLAFFLEINTTKKIKIYNAQLTTNSIGL